MSKFVLSRSYYGFHGCGLNVECDVFDSLEEAEKAMSNEFDQILNDCFQMNRKDFQPLKMDSDTGSSVELTYDSAYMYDGNSGDELVFRIVKI